MSRFIIPAILAALLLSACVSPYQGQANLLNQAYQNGQISANDYQARMTELESLDLQRRQANAQAWQNVGRSMQAYSAQRAAQPPMQIYNPPPRQMPVNTYGTIYTPTGQTYQYNSTTY